MTKNGNSLIDHRASIAQVNQAHIGLSLHVNAYRFLAKRNRISLSNLAIANVYSGDTTFLALKGSEVQSVFISVYVYIYR